MYKTFRRGAGENGGFSLIELIIVVAILAVLVALLAPQYFQYVEKSRKGVCENNRAEVERAYKIACSDIEETPGEALMKKLLKSNGATESGANFEGLCPDGGKIVIRGGDDPYLLCDKHSEMVSSNKEAAVELKAALDKMNEARKKTGAGNYNGSLYSGADKDANDVYKAFYAALNKDALEYLNGKTWQMLNDGSIYIYSGDISHILDSQLLTVDFYTKDGTFSTKEMYVGTATVGENKIPAFKTY